MKWDKEKIINRLKQDIAKDKLIEAIKEVYRVTDHITINHDGNSRLCSEKCIGRFDKDTFKEQIQLLEDTLQEKQG